LSRPRDNRLCEWLEISHVACDDHEIMDDGRSGDHGVLDKIIGFAMHQASPASKGARIHRQHIVTIGEAIEPSLDFSGFRRVLSTSRFDTLLQLAKGHRRDIEILVGNGTQPSNDGAMRTWTPEFGNDVGVEKIHAARSTELGRPVPSLPPAQAERNLGPRPVGQQQVLHSGTRRALHALPLLDRHQPGPIHASFRHDLRTFFEAGFKELAISRSRYREQQFMSR
jgi:hypothetical protein